MQTSFDVIVYGAGVAGCAIARELLARGLSILIVDPRVDFVNGTPGPPAALVNPAMGRYAKLSWEAESCYAAVLGRARELSVESGRTDLIAETGVLRPAISEDLALNFRGTLDAHAWPEGWLSWLDADVAARQVPAMGPQFGALQLTAGFTVYVDRYLDAYRHALAKAGAVFTQDLDTPASAAFRVVAAGAATPEFHPFQDLPLHHVKGQLVSFEADHDLDWDIAVSGMGYILRTGSRGIIAGSTYEHNQNNTECTMQAYQEITRKLFRMFPNLSGHLYKTGQWAGVRVTTPNKLPAIGRHPNHPEWCIYTGLGSKGFLFSEYVAKLLGDHMVTNASLPTDLDVSRFF
jgi:glycine oxidase